MKHAKKRKADGSHVKRLTDEWKELAIFLGDDVLVQKLSFKDVTADQLFYHKKCLTNFHNLNNSKVTSMNKEVAKQRKKWTEANAFNKIVT